MVSINIGDSLQTQISLQEALLQEIRNLRTAVTAQSDMHARYYTNTANGQQRGPAPVSWTSIAQQASGAGTFQAVRNIVASAVYGGGTQTPQAGPGGAAGGGAAPGVGAPTPAAPAGAGGPQGGGQAPPPPPAGGGGQGGAGGGNPQNVPLPPNLPPRGGGGGSNLMNGFMKGGLITSLTKIPGMFRDQVDKLNYYRNITGGGFAEAARERMSEEIFRWKEVPLLSGDEAREAFRGAARLGYRLEGDQEGQGYNQGDIANFVAGGKKQRGQTIEEGLGQMEVFTRTASVSLEKFNDALNKVSKTANEAGVNAEMMRTQFLQTMNMGISRGLSSGAVDTAQAIAQTNTSYGRQFSMNVDSSGVLNSSVMYRAAAVNGMNAGQFWNLQRNNVQRWGSAMDKFTNQVLGTIIPSEVSTWVKNRVQEVGGITALKRQPDLASQLANEMLNRFVGTVWPTPDTLLNVLNAQTGQNFGNVEMAAVWVIENIGGNTIGSQTAMMPGSERTNAAGYTSEGSKVEGLSFMGAPKPTNSTASLLSGSNAFGQSQSWSNMATIAPSTQAYEQWQQNGTGQVQRHDPVVEHLLKNMGGDADQTNVMVHTASGDRVVSMADAIKNFTDEVASGNVSFLDGKYGGQTVSQIAGISANTKLDVTQEESDKSKGNIGISKQDWDKQHGKDDSSSQKVTVDLSPDAKKLLTVMGDQTGNSSLYPSQNMIYSSPSGS